MSLTKELLRSKGSHAKVAPKVANKTCMWGMVGGWGGREVPSNWTRKLDLNDLRTIYSWSVIRKCDENARKHRVSME